MNRLTTTLLLAAGALALAGCPKRPTTPPGPPPAPAAAAESGATSGIGDSRAGEARALPDGAASNAAGVPPAGAALVIYFDYDRSEIRPEFAATISAHARQLAANGAARIRLEGHTDERGSREYNIALGERRAQAVRRALLLQGAGDGQLVTVSYGEERPAVEGSDEPERAKNRRVEIVYGR